MNLFVIYLKELKESILIDILFIFKKTCYNKLGDKDGPSKD